jgi:succinoglycan biosynthesis protein ExoW
MLEDRLAMSDCRLAVIIPFFQRKPGILARALGSVGQQKIPDGWLVEVIVVDDRSPCPVEGEIGNLTFDGPLRLKVIRQEHRGVAAARNRALDEADKDTALIAFLDSDDIWPATHLERMIGAMAVDYDFCFTDSRRIGHYESYLRQYASETGGYIAALAEKKNGFSVIAPEKFLGLMIKEFPAQASTVVYKRRIAPHLRFDTRLKAAGEDLLFLCGLVSRAGSVAFDQLNCVECGVGVNMYYGNLAFDNPNRLAICVDQLICGRLIGKTIQLTTKNKRRNSEVIKDAKRQLAAQTVRSLVKFPACVPKPIINLIKKDTVAAISLPWDIVAAGLRKFRRLYERETPRLTVDES